MPGPIATRLRGHRLHLHHGPIDLVIGADGGPAQVEAAFRAATARFHGLLETLVAEVSALKAPLDGAEPAVHGPVARRMRAAVAPHREEYITAMAAVAGAVADDVLHALWAAARLDRAYVNNGGDIALALAPGHRLAVGVVPSLADAVPGARLWIDAASPVRGIATSGFGGRSLTRGIADAATVLAADGATADAAATILANAVTVEHPAIARAPADTVVDDSDLGAIPVTVAVGPLPAAVIDEALDAGAACADALLARGRIHGAVLALRGRWRVVGSALPKHLEPIAAAPHPGAFRTEMVT